MRDKIMLDVCCGRWGWSKEFAKRGWKCVGVDLHECKPRPQNCRIELMNLFDITWQWIKDQGFLFACASTPCEEFAKFGMRMFHPNPPYPARGIKMFNHIKKQFECSGIPYVMENVRSAEEFVGAAVNRCGPFALWGNVPPLLPQGIIKGMTREALGYRELKGGEKWNCRHALISSGSKSKQRKELVAMNATIPPLLAACVADYADYLVSK